MKGKINIKTILVLLILMFVGVLSVLGVRTAKTYLSGAAGGMEPKNVNGISAADGKTASISWKSDKGSMGVVEYGTTPASLLLRVVEQEQVVDHKLILSELKPGVTYYYRIRVGEEIYDNNGVPYTFKTATVDVVVSPTPQAVVPTVAAGAVISPAASQSAVQAGVCDRTTDYNKDGVVNSIDYISCMNKSATTTKTTTPNSTTTTKATVSPTPTVVKTATSSATTTKTCTPGVDYNADGIVNSLDIIKCRQSAN